MKIVYNELIRDKMNDINIDKRQANYIIHGPDRKKNSDGVFEVRKHIDNRIIMIRYTIQYSDIKIASINEVNTIQI